METNLSQASLAHVHTETLTAVPLSPAIGAEIVGLDLRAPLDDAQFEEILEAWHRYCVLLFRNQHLETEDQLRFAGRFGELSRVINNHSKDSGHASVMLVSNIRKDGQLIGGLPDGEMYFHSDQCYVKQPIKATTLYAIELPGQGGNTLFANMYSAYETLPADALPTIYSVREYAMAGGLMSYGPNLADASADQVRAGHQPQNGEG